MSIKLSNIYKSYGKREVLHNISLEVHAGEIASFLGVNGAGKSTCMKIITGGLSADAGEVFICGHNLKKAPLQAKRLTGYLPENNPLYPEMYVKEYLRYVAGLYRMKEIDLITDKTMERTGLQEMSGKTIGTLSKGYRQRVGLAQALLHNPPVLVLDEPFSGLDPNQLDEMHALIQQLGKEKAILFSSHSLPEVKDLCNHIIILHHGQIVADAPIETFTKDRTLEEKFKELTR